MRDRARDRRGGAGHGRGEGEAVARRDAGRRPSRCRLRRCRDQGRRRGSERGRQGRPRHRPRGPAPRRIALGPAGSGWAASARGRCQPGKSGAVPRRRSRSRPAPPRPSTASPPVCASAATTAAGAASSPAAASPSPARRPRPRAAARPPTRPPGDPPPDTDQPSPPAQEFAPGARTAGDALFPGDRQRRLRRRALRPRARLRTRDERLRLCPHDDRGRGKAEPLRVQPRLPGPERRRGRCRRCSLPNSSAPGRSS